MAEGNLLTYFSFVDVIGFQITSVVTITVDAVVVVVAVIVIVLLCN